MGYDEQVAVFLAYVGAGAKVFLDRRLYLPAEWADDPERRTAAHVPEDVTFHTQGALAQEMLEAAWHQGVPMWWVTGDEAFGDLPYLRDRIAPEGLSYVLAISANTHVWATRPPVVAPRTLPAAGRSAARGWLRTSPLPKR